MKTAAPPKKSDFSPITGVVKQFQLVDKGGYITQEFQDFGYRLAVSLNDLKHKSLYMRLAKQVPRPVLEHALSFVTDAPKARSKAKLFMWKLRELRGDKAVESKPKEKQPKPIQEKLL